MSEPDAVQVTGGVKRPDAGLSLSRRSTQIPHFLEPDKDMHCFLAALPADTQALAVTQTEEQRTRWGIASIEIASSSGDWSGDLPWIPFYVIASDIDIDKIDLREHFGSFGAARESVYAAGSFTARSGRPYTIYARRQQSRQRILERRINHALLPG